LRFFRKLPALIPIKNERCPLVPLPSPAESLPTQPGPVYLRHRAVAAAACFRRLPGASPGVCVPAACVSAGSPLALGLPHPARSAHRVSHPRSGLLLPAPLGLVSSRNAPGILPSELSLPEEPCTSRCLLPSCCSPAPVSMARSASIIQSRVGWCCWRQLQGFAPFRSPFTRARGLAGREVGALLGFSSPGISPSWLLPLHRVSGAFLS
jgi:hypothetical protein